MTRQTNDEILAVLAHVYAGVRCGLIHRTPFELLVATILSAQCTDERVNKITQRLFAEMNTPEEFAAISPADLAAKICGCGLHNTKSANIIAASRKILEDYDGKVPESFGELVTLPGVGRKTANVVLAVAFGQPAIPVDTHVYRVANRLGLACADDVVETEKQLQKAIPVEKWADAHHWLIWHGRKVCKARKPRCRECPVHHLCRYAVSGGEVPRHGDRGLCHDSHDSSDDHRTDTNGEDVAPSNRQERS